MFGLIDVERERGHLGVVADVGFIQGVRAAAEAVRRVGTCGTCRG